MRNNKIKKIIAIALAGVILGACSTTPPEPTVDELKGVMISAAEKMSKYSAIAYEAPIFEFSLLSDTGDSISLTERKDSIPFSRKAINIDSIYDSDIISCGSVNGTLIFKCPSFDTPISIPGSYSADYYREENILYLTLDEKTVNLIEDLGIFEEGTNCSKIKFDDEDFALVEEIIAAAISEFTGIEIDENIFTFNTLVFLLHQIDNQDIVDFINSMPDPTGTFNKENNTYSIHYDIDKKTLVTMLVNDELEKEGLTKDTATQEHIDELTEKYEDELQYADINLCRVDFLIENSEIESVEFNVELSIDSESFKGTSTSIAHIDYLAFDDDVKIDVEINKNDYVAFKDLLLHVVIEYKRKTNSRQY
ncbi:MAG: hypothetical protein WC366_00870 [Bacilli bacterium]|jgi:hypothetical protein